MTAATSDWSGTTPRRWQSESFAIYKDAFADGSISGGIFYAATGAGKSIHIAEVAADLVNRVSGTVIVTTPTVNLVRQLSKTISARVGFPVGTYYTNGKSVDERLIVTCHPSFAPCVAALNERGKAIGAWIADECHRTDSPQILTGFAMLPPDVPRVGWSATPFKSDSAEGLKLWNRALYSYKTADAMADGVLVPVKRHAMPEDARRRFNDCVRKSEAAETEQDAQMFQAAASTVLDDACVDWIASAGNFGVVSAVDILDAERFSERLRDAGISALAIHSNQPPAIQAARIEALQLGKVRCLVHCNLLVEGVDLPYLRFGVLRRIRSRVGFVQEIGRFLRTAPNKTHADLFDPHQMFERYGLTHPAALAGALDSNGTEDETETTPVATVEMRDPLTGRVYKVPAESKTRTVFQCIVSANASAFTYLNEAAAVLKYNDQVNAAKRALGQKYYDSNETRNLYGFAWRNKTATPSQIGALRNMSGAMHVMSCHSSLHAKAIAACYRLLVRHATDEETPLLRGAVSDFFDVSSCIRAPRMADGTLDFRLQDLSFALLAESPIDAEAVVGEVRSALAKNNKNKVQQ